MENRRAITVIGAGLMGHGIAVVFAHAGHRVTVTDPDAASRESLFARAATALQAMGADEAAQEAALARIAVADTLEKSVAEADVVIEAAPENLALKQRIFADLEAAAPSTCLLASNTSVIPITQIVINLKTRERALGTHWWNPPYMIPLVEVIRTEWTDEQAMDAMTDLLRLVGKTPVRVERDVPGFIGNRLQHALWREAISLVEHGVCDASAVDTVINNSFGRRLAVLGPLANADLVGTDLTLAIHRHVLSDLERSPEPSPYLEKLVEDGRLGMKSGQGFHHWTDADARAVRTRVNDHLSKLEGVLN